MQIDSGKIKMPEKSRKVKKSLQLFKKLISNIAPKLLKLPDICRSTQWLVNQVRSQLLFKERMKKKVVIPLRLTKKCLGLNFL